MGSLYRSHLGGAAGLRRTSEALVRSLQTPDLGLVARSPAERTHDPGAGEEREAAQALPDTGPAPEPDPEQPHETDGDEQHSRHDCRGRRRGDPELRPGPVEPAAPALAGALGPHARQDPELAGDPGELAAGLIEEPLPSVVGLASSPDHARS
jgi:hypothetical protein